MLDKLEIWRRKPALWVVPLAFVAVTLLALVLFETAFAGRVDALRQVYDRQAERLETLRAESARAAAFTARLEDQDEAGDVLYDEYFATEGERFTSVLREVRQRAREAGMDPLSFAYPAQEVEAYGLTRRGVNFEVSGTYEQLRRFINLLELTDQFIVLEAVELGDIQGAQGGNADPRLSMRLLLSTIFVDTEYVVRAERAPRVEDYPPAEGELDAAPDVEGRGP